MAASAALARHWWRSSAASVAAALLAAVSPPLIYYSQEARMYELLALLAALSTLLLAALLPALARSGQSNRRRVLAALYVLAVVAGLYTHYFFPAVLAVHNLMALVLLWRHRWRPLWAWAGIMVAAFLFYLPWLPIFLRQTGGQQRRSALSASWAKRSAGWRWAPRRGAGRALGRAGAPSPGADRPLAQSCPGQRAGRRIALAVAGVALPVLLMWLVQATRPAFYKFMVAAIPFLVLLWARGAAQMLQGARSGRARPAFALALLAVAVSALLGTGQALANLYTDPAYARADYRGMAARIAAEAHPNAGIILDAPNQWEVFTYYHREGAPVYPLPRGGPDAAAIAAELEEIAARHDRLYVLFWGEAERDPERLVERWLDAHAFKATDEWVGDVRFVVYAVPPEATAAMETAADVRFGEAIRLRGYTLRGQEVRPGDIVQVTLFWETDRRLEQRYKVFLHLLDQQGQLVAQRDSEPGGGLALTTTWEAGEPVVDNHGVLVSPALAPGAYRLVLGLYDIADPNSRLPLVTGPTLPAGDDNRALGCWRSLSAKAGSAAVRLYARKGPSAPSREGAPADQVDEARHRPPRVDRVEQDAFELGDHLDGLPLWLADPRVSFAQIIVVHIHPVGDG